MFKRIEIKFHDGTGPWADTVDKVIRILSKKTHVEARLPGGNSFSSTNKTGVRYAVIGYSHPERWKTLVFWVTEEEYARSVFRMDLLVAIGFEYDFRGAGGCLLTGSEDIWKYFCSEVLFDTIHIEWLPQKLNHKMHPDRLYEISLPLEKLLLERKLKAEGITSSEPL